MPICIHVDGDPASCYDTATKLDQLSGVVYNDGERVLQTASTQSVQDWIGPAGDAFRKAVGRQRDKAQDLSTNIETLGKAIRQFADDLTTVKTRMSQAREAASTGGLKVNDDYVDDPDATDDAGKLKQTNAYNAALSFANEARKIEKDAHDALDKACDAEGKEAEDFTVKITCLVLDAGHKYIENAVEQARRWSKLAEDTKGSIDSMLDAIARAKAAGVPFPEETAQAALRESADAVEQDIAHQAGNAALILGKTDGAVAAAATASPASTFASAFPEGSTMAKIAEKFPYVGVGLQAVDTGSEMWRAKNPDEIAHAGVRGVASYAAGDAAFGATLGIAEGALGWEGGPVTTVGVLAAVGAAYGVGKLIDWAW
jgi:uncharacterized protein YukE